MENIRRETKISRTVDAKPVPLISFRHSKDYITEKRDILFNRIQRAEIYIHITGESTLFIGNQMRTLQPGDVMIYNKDEVHFSTVKPNTVLERYVLLFLPEAFDPIDGAADHLFNFYYERNSYENNHIPLSDQQRKKLMDILFETDQHIGDNSFRHQLRVYNNTLRIFQIINDAYLAPGGNDTFTDVPKIINDAIHIINREFQQELTLTTLSMRMNVSKSYLSAAFKKYVGVSPYEYLLNVRLENAKRLLSYGESISNTCFESGFSDYSHFIQFFKKRTGITPSKYKRNHRK